MEHAEELHADRLWLLSTLKPENLNSTIQESLPWESKNQLHQTFREISFANSSAPPLPLPKLANSHQSMWFKNKRTWRMQLEAILPLNAPALPLPKRSQNHNNKINVDKFLQFYQLLQYSEKQKRMRKRPQQDCSHGPWRPSPRCTVGSSIGRRRGLLLSPFHSNNTSSPSRCTPIDD